MTYVGIVAVGEDVSEELSHRGVDILSFENIGNKVRIEGVCKSNYLPRLNDLGRKDTHIYKFH